jgi:hypothetical protein
VSVDAQGLEEVFSSLNWAARPLRSFMRHHARTWVVAAAIPPSLDSFQLGSALVTITRARDRKPPPITWRKGTPRDRPPPSTTLAPTPSPRTAPSRTPARGSGLGTPTPTTAPAPATTGKAARPSFADAVRGRGGKRAAGCPVSPTPLPAPAPPTTAPTASPPSPSVVGSSEPASTPMPAPPLEPHFLAALAECLAPMIQQVVDAAIAKALLPLGLAGSSPSLCTTRSASEPAVELQPTSLMAQLHQLGRQLQEQQSQIAALQASLSPRAKRGRHRFPSSMETPEHKTTRVGSSPSSGGRGTPTSMTD